MNKETFLQIIKSYCFISETEVQTMNYWYPLNKVNSEISVVAYDLDAIYRDSKIELIKSVLKEFGIGKVIAVQNQDYKPEPEKLDLQRRLYERDADGYNFPWWVECYYYDETQSWMIYVSHEASITFAGRDIVRIAKATIDDKYLF